MEEIKKSDLGFTLADGITSIDDIMDNLSVKKSDVSDHKAFENLRSICQSIKKGRNNPILIARLFAARLELLEQTAIVYADEGEEELFDVSTSEMDKIKAFLTEIQ